MEVSNLYPGRKTTKQKVFWYFFINFPDFVTKGGGGVGYHRDLDDSFIHPMTSW